MATSDRLPTAALIALWNITNTALGGGVDNGGVLVSMGDPGAIVPPEYAAVGWSPPNQSTLYQGLRGTASIPSMGNRARAHQFDIACTVSVAGGDVDQPGQDAIAQANINRCTDLWVQVLAALRADMTLGGVVPLPGFADLGDYEWAVGLQGAGVATVVYAVHVDEGWQP